MTIIGEAVVIFKGKDEITPAIDKITGEASTQGTSLGSKIMGGLGGALKAGAIGVGVAVGGTLTTAIFKGWNRLTAIEDAEAKLKGLGHSAGEVKDIMDNALAAVQGTAFGLDEAAGIAATAVAAGVKPGKQLEANLKLVGDAATIAGTSMEDMGGIFNKVAASNKLQGDSIQSLQTRGIPIMQFLGDTLGKTTAQVQEMVSSGKVDFADFSKAMQEGVGGAALKSGNTTSGAFKNMGAALSRFGADLLQGIFPLAKKVFNGITDLLDDVTAALDPFVKKFSGVLGDAFKNIWGIIQNIAKGIGPLIKTIADSVKDLFAGDGSSSFLDRIQPLIQAFKDFGSFIGDSLIPSIEKLWKAFAPVAVQIGKIALPVVIAGFSLLGRIFREFIGPALAIIVDLIVKFKTPLLILAGFISAVMIPILLLWAAAWVASLGPIGLIILAILAIGAAFVLLKPVIKNVIEFLGGLFGTIVKFFSGLGSRILGALGSLWGKVKSGFTNFFNAAKDAVINFLTAYITFYIRLPGRIANALGNIWGAISSIFQNLWSAIRDNVQNGIAAIVNFFIELPGRIVRGLGNIGSVVGSAIRNGLSNIKDTVMGVFSNAGSWLIDIGSKIISGLINGVTDAVEGGLKSAIQSIPGKLVSWKGPEAYDRQLLVPTGGWIMGGLVDGINKSLPNLKAALGGVTSTIGGTNGAIRAGVTARANAETPNAGGRAGGVMPRKVILRVGRREFDAYVEEIADQRIEAQDALAWQGG